MSAATNISAPEFESLPVPVGEAAEFRSRIGNISRQSAVYFAGTILTAAAGYFFKIYLARALGAEALGLYALGMSIIGFVTLLNAFGLPSAAARYIADYSSRRDFARLAAFFTGSLSLLCLGSLFLGLLVVTLGPWFATRFYHAPALAHYFGYFALIMIFGVLTAFLGQAMAGYRDVARRTLITHFIGTPLNMILAIVLISLGFGLAGYLAAQVVSAVLVLLLLGMALWRLTPIPARRASKFVFLEREVVSFSAAAFGLAFLEFALAQADKIVLGLYLNVRDVGVYAVASALVAFVPIALQSVNQIFSPTIAELHACGNYVLLQQLYSTLTRWILVVTVPLALAMIVFARPMIEIFGPAFETGAAVLIIGTVAQLVNCGVGSVGFLLMMSGNQMRLVRIQATSAVLVILLSVLLVPQFGIAGAALATAAALISTNLWSLRAVSGALKLFPYDSSYFKLVLPAAITASVLVFVRYAVGPHSSWRVAAIGVALSYAVFLGALLVTGVNQQDRRIAHVLWQKFGLTSVEIGE
jgi:O-antigen/teichoic acid export membrane protein